ncbi:MAG: cyclopropane fatty acyl phospholipid synthase [Chlorobium phaeovibrioides]|nr:cyclopropane fatty acyl phospholipid synthase [Chlorobium phaeovibrioides]
MQVMGDSYFRYHLQHLLATAGVTIDGPEPWDISIHDKRFYRRVLTEGHLGVGESYMDGWWDCPSLDEFFYMVLRAGLEEKVSGVPRMLNALAGRLVNLQGIHRARKVGKAHYDIGNDLYRIMLDRRMMYSCGYWHNAETLEEAQEQKLRLVFSKLQLEAGMKVLDIGCGWGGAARFAAEEYGAEVTGITISKEQAHWAEAHCKGQAVNIRLEDYRKTSGKYDRIYSIGMFEHVGYKNYRRFFRTVRQHLNADGLFLLHTIGSNRSDTNTDPWTTRYIFPNSMLPSARQITAAAEGLMVLEDWHSFGHDYFHTLKAWHANVEKNSDYIEKHYGKRFMRMWRYYLLSSAGSFRGRNVQLWQILFSPKGIEGSWRVPR